MDSHPGLSQQGKDQIYYILRVSHPEEGQQLPVKEITGTQWKAIEKIVFIPPRNTGSASSTKQNNLDIIIIIIVI